MPSMRHDDRSVDARVLIVEDEPAIRALVAEVLTSEGFHTEEAADGLIALEKVRHLRPDVVVLDMYMPRMDGWEFLNVGRMIPEFKATPVVVLSASDSVPEDKRVKAFLKKPFDIDLLPRLLAAVLDSAS